MKIPFRVECPHCYWGYPAKNSNINMGWVHAKCGHCKTPFSFKVNIPSVTVEVNKDLIKQR